VNTGTNAADSAACENRLLNRFGICEASVNADAEADVLKNAACAISRPRPAIRETAVAAAKIAVLTAIRRRGFPGGELLTAAESVSVSTRAAIVRARRGGKTAASLR
jgi:hypothetical protein